VPDTNPLAHLPDDELPELLDELCPPQPASPIVAGIISTIAKQRTAVILHTSILLVALRRSNYPRARITMPPTLANHPKVFATRMSGATSGNQWNQ
jgi:hypothetical protein